MGSAINANINGNMKKISLNINTIATMNVNIIANIKNNIHHPKRYIFLIIFYHMPFEFINLS